MNEESLLQDEVGYDGEDDGGDDGGNGVVADIW